MGHHERTALETIDNFVHSIHFSKIGDILMNPTALSESQKVASTYERRTIVEGNSKFTFHGLGNDVALLQVYDKDTGLVSALWYLDWLSTKMEWNLSRDYQHTTSKLLLGREHIVKLEIEHFHFLRKIIFYMFLENK